MDAFTKSGERGILAVFKSDPNIRLSPLEMSYRIQEDGALKAVYLLANYTGEPLKYRIICLIDYRQQMFTLDNRVSKTHEISLLPGEQKIFTLATAPIRQGAHDFVLLAVREGVKQIVDFPILSHRANLFVKAGGFPSIEYEQTNAVSLSSTPNIDVVLNRSAKVDAFTPVGFNLEQAAEYFLQVGNIHEQTTRYAVIFFADFEQLSFDVSNAPKAYYMTLAGRTAGIIPWKIPENQYNQLFAIVLENPYQTMEPKLEIMTTTPVSTYLSNVLTKTAN